LSALPLRGELESYLRSVGFTEVEIDPRGFRSGSLNDALRAT
jgi:PP-loop superfamily ATP-utilizing enzyme